MSSMCFCLFSADKEKQHKCLNNICDAGSTMASGFTCGIMFLAPKAVQHLNHLADVYSEQLRVSFKSWITHIISNKLYKCKD